MILLLGARLLLNPEQANSWWPWTISPYDAGFLGVFSLAEFSAILVFLVVTCWAPGRLVIPSWFTFTALVAIASLLNHDQFILDRQETRIWFGMYLSSPPLAAWFQWRYRRMPPADPAKLSSTWQHYLQVQAGLMGLFGIGLFIFPSVFGAAWPWSIAGLTAQVYAAMFLTSAVGAAILLRAAASVEVKAYALPQVILGWGAIAALVTVDTALQSAGEATINWGAPGTWAWAVGLYILGASGTLLMVSRSTHAR